MNFFKSLKTTNFSKTFSVVFMCCSALTLDKVLAQSMSAPPVVAAYDSANVDLVGKYPVFQQTDLSIGSGENSLSHTIASYNGYFWGFVDDYTINIAFLGGPFWRVNIGHASYRFRKSGSTFSPEAQDGSILIQKTDGSFVFTDRVGTSYTIKTNPQVITTASGFQTEIHWGAEITHPDTGDTLRRIQSVTTNTGLQFKYVYASNSWSSNTIDPRHFYDDPIRIIAINNAVEYCNPLANTCDLTNDWPEVNYHWPERSNMFPGRGGSTSVRAVFEVEDAEGAKTAYKHRPIPGVNNDLYNDELGRYTRIYEIRHSTSSGQYNRTYQYDHYLHCYHNGLHQWECPEYKPAVAYQVDEEGKRWTYHFPPQRTSQVATGDSDAPRGRYSIVMANQGGLYSVRRSASTPELHIVYNENTANRPKTVNYKGISTEYDYDTRGNITKITQGPSAIEPLITEASYPAICVNQKTCNHPEWIKDPRGNTTNFAYHGGSGKIAKTTQPADETGVRPQTRYKYEQKYAWLKDASGSIVQADSPVWLLTEESTCSQGQAANTAEGGCANPNFEIITRYGYGTGSSTKANNLWLKSVAVDAYNVETQTRETRLTCYQHDNLGNVIAETLPNANLASCP